MSKHIPLYKSKSPSALDWARMAAYIDGEGCIRIRFTPNPGGRSTALLVVVSNCDVRLMKWLKDTFWFLTTRKLAAPFDSLLQLGGLGQTCEWVLTNCMDLFIMKRDQAEVEWTIRPLWTTAAPD